MMPLVSPPRTASAPSYRASDATQSSFNVYQAIPDFTALHSDPRPRQHFEEELAPLPPFRPRHRVRQPRGCNLVRPYTLAGEITRMVLYNGCSAALSITAALIVWVMAALSVLMIPLCGCGVSVFNGLLHAVFYLCCTDAFIDNALAASSADCIDMDLAEWGVDVTSSELHPLLPIRVPPPIGGAGEQMFEPCPRFERSLGTPSPRSVLAVAYFGCFKLLVGAGQVITVTLVLGVLGFLIGDKRVPIHLDTLTVQHPFAVYTTTFGLLLIALALLHGMTRVSKLVTRFFCCDAVRR
ncbi:hypothetical protein PInf_015415 [Phytophthora infestans]|nr:hypothetical protein PInf_015415 [Phytophthora infestans]